ncbi:hypothetical protein PVAND_017588 [Polypedilum vanderplanki]|uniref:Uncharacterized protein n=1 Tax=Polypedilum vanderplanki TaxID=319348 RepID=A0A9J6B9A4_POLVA|nr:hypothetical protein PVAND_017588 [Polypedilum vanderplanki]
MELSRHIKFNLKKYLLKYCSNHDKNVTRSRVIKFCCPGYEEFETDGKKLCISNDTITTTTQINSFRKDKKTITNSQLSTEKNPYQNYSGEYGKEFNHYVKMGLNESDAQQSVNKIVEYEMEKAKENLANEIVEEADGYIFVDVTGNEIEPLKHPQYVTDHHLVGHHEETVAMVTVGCLVLGMCIFLIIMVYIMRKQQSRDDRDVEFIDPRFETKKSKLPPSKIVHEPLPIPPLRPSLRKHKSVTFDESIDEVDEFNRRRTRSLPDAYDVPRKQTSMIDLYAQSIKISPKDIAAFTLSQNSGYHTFPKKSVSRKSSLEHIYDEIPNPTIEEKKNKNECEINKNESNPTEVIYTNMNKKKEKKQDKDETEKTKM